MISLIPVPNVTYKVFGGTLLLLSMWLMLCDWLCVTVATPSEHNLYRKELNDMLHDLNILENIEQLTTQLRLKYEVDLL